MATTDLLLPKLFKNTLNKTLGAATSAGLSITGLHGQSCINEIKMKNGSIRYQ